MTEYKDQGLKKAAKQSKTPQLPSNFTYRMMKRIGEEMYLREKRQEKRLFILMIITLTLLLIFTVIYFVMPVNAEEKETSYAIEEIQTQTVKESENKNDNNTLNIDSNNATSQETEETQENTLAEIRDTLYIISITLIIFTGAFLGYVAVSRLM